MKMLNNSVKADCKNVKKQVKDNSKKSMPERLIWLLQSPVRVQDEVMRLQMELAELNKRIKP